ncbi:hypothetical protein RND81_09G083300 [Saponaria officinalis]|uniref:Uncharacterized protein n=1 Tax=Saponaria officinalis TaxID=3572 RepID=A0AAW1IIC5_SAPOF
MFFIIPQNNDDLFPRKTRHLHNLLPTTAIFTTTTSKTLSSLLLSITATATTTTQTPFTVSKKRTIEPTSSTVSATSTALSSPLTPQSTSTTLVSSATVITPSKLRLSVKIYRNWEFQSKFSLVMIYKNATGILISTLQKNKGKVADIPVINRLFQSRKRLSDGILIARPISG